MHRVRRILTSTLIAAAGLGVAALPASADPPDNFGCPPPFTALASSGAPPDRNGDFTICGGVAHRFIDNNVGGPQ